MKTTAKTGLTLGCLLWVALLCGQASASNALLRNDTMAVRLDNKAFVAIRQIVDVASGKNFVAQTAKPNILFIITDQQHAGMLSCAGNPHLRTPALDRLAASGARFERAYCGNPVCLPSRTSMLLGVLPSHVGIGDNGGERVRVPEEVLAHSMGRVFRDAGYETVYGGKLHTPMTLGEMGFERLSKDERLGLAQACAGYLRKKRDRPFLLVASFINPHDICYMALRDYELEKAQQEKASSPEEKQKRLPKWFTTASVSLATLDEALKSPDGISREEFFAKLCPPLPANFEVPTGEPEEVLKADPRPYRPYLRQHRADERWRMHRWAYARLTEKVDAEIAVVLAALRDAGLEEDTLVVFTSDHGDMDASHRLEHKSVLYEESVHVPLIVYRKGVTKPGLVDREHLVSSAVDLIPTMCDFAGIPAPAALHGRSVRALAEGRASEAWRDCLVAETLCARMVRTARYKYIVCDSGARREQLIDLEKDPGEMRNLAADPAYAKILTNHRRLLVRWYEENNETLDPKYVLR